MMICVCVRWTEKSGKVSDSERGTLSRKGHAHKKEVEASRRKKRGVEMLFCIVVCFFPLFSPVEVLLFRYTASAKNGAASEQLASLYFTQMREREEGRDAKFVPQPPAQAHQGSPHSHLTRISTPKALAMHLTCRVQLQDAPDRWSSPSTGSCEPSSSSYCASLCALLCFFVWGLFLFFVVCCLSLAVPA
jgi:hypothetical protein